MLWKKHDVIKHDWYSQSEHIVIVQEFDLHDINPLNYSKIEFLGSDEDFKPTKVSWSRVAYESDKKISNFNHANLRDLIKNQKFQYKEQIQTSNYDHNEEFKKRTGEIDEDSSKHYSPSIIIQPRETKYYTLVEWIEFEQDFEIAFYWEKGHYYLQVVARQYAHDNPGSVYGGSLWLGFGNGIRLYN